MTKILYGDAKTVDEICDVINDEKPDLVLPLPEWVVKIADEERRLEKEKAES